ncbi:hypothetical protein [Streptomyces sp. NPDC058255]|uniref:hypothetical protein n=1 Tax=Streptomyces sp. NPDC058255 TaxID=3346407 RepID=UPI0036E5C1B7
MTFPHRRRAHPPGRQSHRAPHQSRSLSRTRLAGRHPARLLAADSSLLAAGCWLLVEWPANAEAPIDHWLSNLPANTPITDLVRLAEIHRRIEHDYRELKHGLGLDHFEGRSRPGWHHHVTLLTTAHAFLTEQRLPPKVPASASPSTRSSTPSRTH